MKKVTGEIARVRELGTCLGVRRLKEIRFIQSMLLMRCRIAHLAVNILEEISLIMWSIIVHVPGGAVEVERKDLEKGSEVKIEADRILTLHVR